MTKLEPKICGKWDGNALWLQWNQLEDRGTAFELQIRYGRKEGEWGPWIPTVPPQGGRSHWGVIPTWKEGYFAQARVRPIDTSSAPEWEIAEEVTFTKCSADFEISSMKYDQYFTAGTIFHAQVAGAACAYQTKEEISVKAGESLKVKLFAMGASGYFQLDEENDFDVRPTFGVRVRNLTASIEDIKETKRDFTVIEGKKPDPVTMTVTPADRF